MSVISVLGHVDHGKSTLLKALTGMDPDKRPLSITRGMTIDLGFVHLSADGDTIGLVDVPGHKQYMKNLIAGLMQVDAFLFVVAADDGWMPQSDEHLGLVKALKKKLGLIVITKSDLASPDKLENLKEQCVSKFTENLGREFECCCVSVKDERSLEMLRKKIVQLNLQMKKEESNTGARLWIDKRFTPQGQSVVVTGTLSCGAVRLHDPLYLWPALKEVKVKRIECYGKEVETVKATSRVALQLGQCKSENVSRGSCLSNISFSLTKSFDAEIEYWQAIPKRNVRGKLSLGTLDIPATLVALGGNQRQFVRVRLVTQIPVIANDKFIFRTSGGEKIIGGGIVLDPKSSVKRHEDAVQRLEAGSVVESPQRKEREKSTQPSAGLSSKENEILSLLRTKGVPTPFEALGLSKAEKGIPYELARRKELMKLGDDHFLDKEIYLSYAKEVFHLLSKCQFAKTSELKELLGKASRKHAVLILERMDEDRVTYLKDGVRRLLRHDIIDS